MADLAWGCAGVVREAEGLERGLAELDDLSMQVRALPLASARDRRVRADLSGMHRVLQAIFAASRARRESRGCFLRKGHPLEDDRDWLKNSRVQLSGDFGKPAVDHLAAAR
jgi:succinate dehydrogenase/fumarate reductase flavoprotein subunit